MVFKGRVLPGNFNFCAVPTRTAFFKVTVMTNSHTSGTNLDINRPLSKSPSRISTYESGIPDTTPKDFSQQPRTVIRLKQLQAVIGLKRSAIYYLMGDGPRGDPSFPLAIKLSKRAIGFDMISVLSWLESRKTRSRSKTGA